MNPTFEHLWRLTLSLRAWDTGGEWIWPHFAPVSSSVVVRDTVGPSPLTAPSIFLSGRWSMVVDTMANLGRLVLMILCSPCEAGSPAENWHESPLGTMNPCCYVHCVPSLKLCLLRLPQESLLGCSVFSERLMFSLCPGFADWTLKRLIFLFCYGVVLLLFSCSVVSDSLQPHGL